MHKYHFMHATSCCTLQRFMSTVSMVNQSPKPPLQGHNMLPTITAHVRLLLAVKMFHVPMPDPVIFTAVLQCIVKALEFCQPLLHELKHFSFYFFFK